MKRSKLVVIGVAIIIILCSIGLAGLRVVRFTQQQQWEQKDLIVPKDLPLILSKPPELEIRTGKIIVFDSGRGNIYYGALYYKDHNWMIVIRNIGSRESSILYVWKDES